MSKSTSRMFHLFDQQFHEARRIFNSLAKNFKSKKAMDLKEKLVFINVFLHLISKIHFTKEESLKFEPFNPFLALCKALNRIHHYKSSVAAYAAAKAGDHTAYDSYDRFLAAIKEEAYGEVDQVVRATPPTIWDELYATAFDYTRATGPLMIDTATSKLISEEIENIGFPEEGSLDSHSINEITEALRTVTLVENIRIALGLNPVYTAFIHGEMGKLNRVLQKWYQNHLFAQHLNHFFSEKEQVSPKYLDLAKAIKGRKLSLTQQVDTLSTNLFSKVAV